MSKDFKSIIEFNEYTVNEGGYRHLPLDIKLNVIENLEFEQLTVCDAVTEHYNYFKEKVNYNQNDCCNLSL